MITIPIRGHDPQTIRRQAAAVGLRLPPEELLDLAQRLGRDPTLPEAFLFDVAMSEHCSYKSSRPLLKAYLPPLASHVILGPGEDAGVVRLGVWQGEEWALVVAHESHNHPSQVLPVEGAATGVGGIVRDVYCMGADVVGVMDGLRFGNPDGPFGERVRAIGRGVVHGISEYGNALGVPNLGGDVAFHEGFDDNCLVNVVAFGVVPSRRIIRSRVPVAAHHRPYLLVLVGKPTDDTGLGGASFASQILDEEDEGENRGAVQIHDPFLKRVLVEATKDVWGWIEREAIEVGCKDLGAGGLGGASSELCLAGGFGAEIDLSHVPQGLPDLQPHQVLCAETQERFVWAVPEDRAEEFCAYFNEIYELGRIYPNAAARVIGRVIEDPVYRCRWEGDVVVEVPNAVLEEAPVLDRPRLDRPGRPPESDPAAPASGEGDRGQGKELAGGREVARGRSPAGPPQDEEAWKRWAVAQLTSWRAASRAPVYRFYDPEVRGEAFLRPGEADAGICRPVPGAPWGLAVSLDGNPDYGALDPYWAGALAVLESARNVACAGAVPIALTDCLNFGSPEDPVCLGDFEKALQGMAAAAAALGSPGQPEEPLPIVSGNVSFYNQSSAGRAVPPSPIVCCYGFLEDYGRSATPRLRAPGNPLLIVGRRERAWGRPRQEPGGRVPRPDIDGEARLTRLLPELIRAGLARSCHDIADGGLLRTAWEMMASEDPDRTVGVALALDEVDSAPGMGLHEILVSESPGVVIEVSESDLAKVRERVAGIGFQARSLGRVIERSLLSVYVEGTQVFALPSSEIHRPWLERLEGVTYREAVDATQEQQS